jgi:cytochrome c5
VKRLAAFFFLSILALAQDDASSKPAPICPLSDAQTQKSIEAFSKIASTLTGEPRCSNCHGGVNPYIEDPGLDPDDKSAPPSKFAHGGGQQSREHDKALDGTPLIDTGCQACHSNMAPKTGGGESIWTLAPTFLSFVDKDAKTLCKQIRGASRDANEFKGHLKDDNGGNNFGGTAFNGNRGLPEGEVEPVKPEITHEELEKLGEDWVATTGGEFQGDKDCGCEPAHYAIRMSILNQTNLGPVQRTSVMQPLNVPIVFKEDGTFSGDSEANFQAAGTAAPCVGQANSTLAFHVSVQAIATSEKQSMHFQIENSSPTVTNATVQCPVIGGVNTRNTTQQKMMLPFDFKGNVGEAFDYHMPAIPGHTSTMHIEIVKLDEPKK